MYTNLVCKPLKWKKGTSEEDVGNNCIYSELEMCIISNTFLYVFLFCVLLDLLF